MTDEGICRTTLGPMKLRTSTIAGLLLMLGALMWGAPIAAFDATYEGIPEDRFQWTCPTPILGLFAEPSNLEEIRSQVAELEDGEVLEVHHPDCRNVAIAQVIMGAIAFAAGAWQTARWRRETADERAEKKFEKLQDYGSGKKKSILG